MAPNKPKQRRCSLPNPSDNQTSFPPKQGAQPLAFSFRLPGQMRGLLGGVLPSGEVSPMAVFTARLLELNFPGLEMPRIASSQSQTLFPGRTHPAFEPLLGHAPSPSELTQGAGFYSQVGKVSFALS